MTRVVSKAMLCSFCVLACSWLLLAVSPKFWELYTQEDLLKGKLRGVSLTSDGKLMLAPQYETVFDTEQALAFALARDPARNIYIGTGHEGRVFKVDPRGAGSLFFKSEQLDIFALACDTQGNVYVGSSPDGKVYKVGSNGQGVEFFDPDDKYIWDLVFDREGNLYVASGGKGLLYRVDRTGKGSVLFDSDDTHLMSLAVDLDGNIVAGSSPKGLVYRVSKEGKAFVLLDTPQAEVRRVAVDRLGDVYAVALSGAASGPSKDSDAESALMRIRSLAIPSDELNVDTPPAAALDDLAALTAATTGIQGRSGDKGGARSVLYRITKEGTIESIWSSNTEMVFDFAVRDDGKILAGTGTRGRLLAIDPQRTYAILTESQDEHVTRLLVQGSEVFAATSNLGKLYRMLGSRAQRGEYESQVFDAGLPSSWGQIRWKVAAPAGTTVEVFTRSGNTLTQDKSWSDWSGPYVNAGGQAVQSPRARYIQWKAVFKSSSSEERRLMSTEDALEDLTLAYLQQNVRPRVNSISVLTSGIALQKIPVTPSGGGMVTVGGVETGNASGGPAALARNRLRAAPRRIVKTGSQSLTWKAEDENDDDLLYELYFKGDNEADWKLLEKELEDDFYTIDTNALPDGTYTVKVVASDAPSNAYGSSLRGELISKPFVINNSPPAIEQPQNEVQGKRVAIRYRARHATTAIYSSEFSIDGGPWLLVFPEDGIADSREEQYRVLTPELSSGEHIIGVRVSDAVGNVGTHKVIVKIP